MSETAFAPPLAAPQPLQAFRLPSSTPARGEPGSGFTGKGIRTTLPLAMKCYLHVSFRTCKSIQEENARRPLFRGDARRSAQRSAGAAPHVPIEKARQAANAALLGAVGPTLHSVTDFAIPAPGRILPARLYRPSALANFPVLLFLHGGGWVWGSLDTHDPICRELARSAGCAVVSIDYRLAPETSFPGPADDAFEALQWIAASASALGLDATKLAIGGRGGA
jgi:acetyl esterase/lipase